MQIVRVDAEGADLEEVRLLLHEYQGLVRRHHPGADFAAEIAGLPGEYAPPTGRILLAREGDRRAAGCVVLRPSNGGACEMRRMYVPADLRGRGIGRSLAVR
ncbi:MAG: GNAT family N-acetyltransferase, partial [Candidatus Eisenbacteria bacterium]|nr:GNAT family N-acetyltransferase [Candidatus Latescibacterota bacterium]MBD3302261.1 GNAT family N-acetyltransferase [Candidatus Eisenbacteria bacterium]